MQQPIDEKSLVARARSGSEEAFRTLLRSYRNPVYNLALRILKNREDAEDAVQDVFVKVHGALGQYDPNRAFRSWVFRITHNHCIDMIRRRRLTTISIDEPVSGTESESGWDLPDLVAESPLEAASREETARFLRDAIDSLNPILKSAITLRHVEGLRYDEIAEILQIPLGTVKVRIFRAREQLARLLGDTLGKSRE